MNLGTVVARRATGLATRSGRMRCLPELSDRCLAMIATRRTKLFEDPGLDVACRLLVAADDGLHVLVP